MSQAVADGQYGTGNFERTGERGWEFSTYHRCFPRPANAIDLDWLEVCSHCWKPLIVGELARDIGQTNKQYGIIRNLAALARIEGRLVYYQADIIRDVLEHVLGKRPTTMPSLAHDKFAILLRYFHADERKIIRMQMVYPRLGDERRYTTAEFFDWLTWVHHCHEDESGCKK